MSARLLNPLLHVFAFLAPIYFIFYPSLHESPRSRTAAQLWRTTMAGFGFWAAAGTVYLIAR